MVLETGIVQITGPISVSSSPCNAAGSDNLAAVSGRLSRLCRGGREVGRADLVSAADLVEEAGHVEEADVGPAVGLGLEVDLV